jgi:hypothetical protein
MRRRARAIAVGAALLIAAAGCARTARMTFRTDPGINGGMLVPVDVIATTAAKAPAILKIGPDEWFASDARSATPENEIRRIALKPGEVRLVKFTGPKGTDTFVVFADLAGVRDAEAQQAVFSPKAGKTALVLRVQAGKLTVEEKK